MPSYLDFDSTKRFRDFILGKTLQKPNGPQEQTNSAYSIQNLSNVSNIDQPEVDFNRVDTLVAVQNSNIFKPLEYLVKDTLNVLPRRANLTLYPYFDYSRTPRTLVGVFNNEGYDNESEIYKFAADYINKDKGGPILARIQQNIEASTNGRLRILDALQGNTTTAINIVTGREPLVEPVYKITVAKTLPGKAIDFLQTVAGTEFPWSEIPGDYLSDPKNPINYRPTPNTELGKLWQDATGALGSLIGIQRRPTTTRKPSDLLIEYMGDGQKSTLYDLLSYSKYAPNYTTTARSQNTSKVFNFIDKAAQGVKSFLGVEAPNSSAYIGDDRGDDVKYAMNDFNDRPVKSNYYLSLLFDPVQTELFERKRNVSEGGNLGGKLTWISQKSKNKVGDGNAEWASQQTGFNDSLSTNFAFREDSLLGYTQDLLDTLPTNGGAARSHVANVIDQTSRVFKEGDTMMSRGSAVKYVDKFTGDESGVEYCRVWTKDRAYFNYSDTMKTTGNIRKFEGSVMSTPWNLNIAPMSNGKKEFGPDSNIVKGADGFYAKKYMFSIENLAWKTSRLPGFSVNDLPYCERGPNGGRVMWFPPYDLKVSEQNNARWESNTFLGRPEPIYTYQNTERSGTISFKVVVDHPSILNLLVREHFNGMSDEEADNYINAFFAGCEDVDFYDLIRRYSNITPDDAELIKKYLEQGVDAPSIKKYRQEFLGVVEDAPVTSPEPTTKAEEYTISLNFANDEPDVRSEGITASKDYTTWYNSSIGNAGWTGRTMTNLETILKEIYSGTTTYNKQTAINDKKVLHGKDIPTGETATKIAEVKTALTKEMDEAVSGYTTYTTQLQNLKNEISGGTVQEVTIGILSSTSAVADNSYNYKLSIRRSHSIIQDVLRILNNGGSTKFKWPEKVPGSAKTKVDIPVEVLFSDLGYKENKGKIIFKTINGGEEYQNENGKVCGDQNFKYVSSGGYTLKISAPVAFGCRQTTLKLKYNKIVKQPDNKPTTDIKEKPPRTRLVPDDGAIDSVPKRKTIPIDPMKRIIMKTLSECYYFQKLEESDPVVFSSLKEKLKYFHPGFHSTTPEGLNSRLTFIQQCIRPGDTIPIKGISDDTDMNARNTTFGPPPVCVLRIGDFYHSKIIIRDVSITFDDTTWDLNPEGIGVQPMIANVSLQINFIGGQGLERPVERLQNALSSNFYANTEMYDERSIATNSKIAGKDAKEFTKEFLEELLKNTEQPADSNNNDTGNKVTNGLFIGTLKDNTLTYTDIIEKGIFENTKKYFDKYSELYNVMVNEYGPIVSSMILHPNYRPIKNYDISNSPSGVNTIDLFGQFKKGKELSNLQRIFKIEMLNAIDSIDVSTMMGFNKELTVPKLNKSNELLRPYLKSFVEKKIDGISNKTQLGDFEKLRNELTMSLDKVNFLVKYGYDAKVENEKVTKAVLSGYTYDLIFNEYSSCIEYITENTGKMYEDLDNSLNFYSPVIDLNKLSNILSIWLREDKNNLFKIYEVDKTIFDDKTIDKMKKRFDSFIGEVKEKNFKFKKFKERKNSNEITYSISSTEEDTSSATVDIKKIYSSKVPLTGDKLNFYKNEP